MTNMSFNFKEDEDFFYFVELILDSGLTRIKNYKKLEAEIASLKNENSVLKDVQEEKKKNPALMIIPKSLKEAQKILQSEGYIFYKKPANFGKNGRKGRPQKRHRRTKAEIEAARANESIKK